MADIAIAAPNMSTEGIHSELLCFINNKIQTVPFEMLVKQCVDFYSSEQIQAAKDLFWETAISLSPDISARKDMRNIRRRDNGTQKKERLDMEDLIKAIQACDKAGFTLPRYYLLDLGNVPPVSAEHVDMTIIMGQMSAMQKEMSGLRAAVTSLQEASERTGQRTERSPVPSWAEVTASGTNPSRPSPSTHKEVLPKVQSRQEPAQEQEQSAEDSEVQQPRQQQHRQVDEEGFTVVSKKKKTNRRNELKG